MWPVAWGWLLIFNRQSRNSCDQLFFSSLLLCTRTNGEKGPPVCLTWWQRWTSVLQVGEGSVKGCGYGGGKRPTWVSYLMTETNVSVLNVFSQNCLACCADQSKAAGKNAPQELTHRLVYISWLEKDASAEITATVTWTQPRCSSHCCVQICVETAH